jgi:hypothetical protein
MDVAPVGFEREREACRGGLECCMKRNTSLVWLGYSILGDIRSPGSVFILVRLDWGVTRVQDASAVPLGRSIREYLAGIKWPNEIFD